MRGLVEEGMGVVACGMSGEFQGGCDCDGGCEFESGCVNLLTSEICSKVEMVSRSGHLFVLCWFGDCECVTVRRNLMGVVGDFGCGGLFILSYMGPDNPGALLLSHDLVRGKSRFPCQWQYRIPS